jgi:hypothetical protein
VFGAVGFFHPYDLNVDVFRVTSEESLLVVNVLSAVRVEYKACRWTKDFLLARDKET